MLIIFTMIISFAATDLKVSACTSCIGSGWNSSWDIFKTPFFDSSWVYRDDDKAVLDFEEEEEASECDDGCGCEVKPYITAPTCEREGNFYAYRQGECPSCKANFRRWSSTDDMQDYIPEGATIREEGGIDVYIVKYMGGKMFKRLVLNPQVFENYEHLRWEDVMNVSADVLGAYTTSDLVRSEETGKVYRLYPNEDCGTKQLVEYHGCFWKRIDWDAVYTINGYDERSYTTSSTLK